MKISKREESLSSTCLRAGHQAEILEEVFGIEKGAQLLLAVHAA